MRTAMLFMAHKWPKMIMMNLWSYAMHTANEIMIPTPTMLQSKTQQELFSGVNISDTFTLSGSFLSRENAWRIFSVTVIFVLTSAKLKPDVRIFTFSLSYFGK